MVYTNLTHFFTQSCLQSEDDNNEESKRDGYLEIYQALGLSGDDNEQINLTRFRRIISDNLDIDESFMFKRVFNAFDGSKSGYVSLTVIFLIVLNIRAQLKVNIFRS